MNTVVCKPGAALVSGDDAIRTGALTLDGHAVVADLTNKNKKFK